MRHQEVNDSAFRTTAEALVTVAFWVNDKRAHRVVFMKRAKSKVSHAFLLQRNEVSDDLFNLRRLQNLVDFPLLYFCHNRGKNFISIKGTGSIINEGISFITIKGWTAYIVKPNVRSRVARGRVSLHTPIFLY